ncbi:NAD(P) transhydrogenase subunit alpha [Actinoplanes sp. TRM 88003]|uniref:proton-translocating NAD(P)(+) transhydrogenase n=1 Tax=Paractinoplanes aksuensis TaxID=2939490 RepID=A0ABT1DYH8_9ACTN|nr:NAD(P) transhydrogenase subunit alpha [Actinoplanes aksuensis]MCO8275945.1 NAD(P) transhydrogenase subunit alpha [Actinoplanes aksuensis]
MTTVGVLRETALRERRVALTPDGVARLRRGGEFRVLVEAGAGRPAWFDDRAYAEAGAEIGSRHQVYDESDVLVVVRPPDDVAAMPPGRILIGLLDPLGDPALTELLAGQGVTAISLDLLPRTLSRAQPMDALTSQANVAGYKAALLAAEAYGGFFPMLVTAAGTTRPAQVLVLGAGVAGLQALATARRLGALVTGFDVREAARADIASTGAAVLDLGTGQSSDDGSGRQLGSGQSSDDGYARQLGDDQAARQLAALTEAVPRFDVVITTAKVPGGRSPLLVSDEALAAMKPGSVVIDLGGNVAGAAADTRTVTDHGVTVIGAPNLASTVPVAASTAYARNVVAVVGGLMPEGRLPSDSTDEVLAAVLVTHEGEVVHPRLRVQNEPDHQEETR